MADMLSDGAVKVTYVPTIDDTGAPSAGTELSAGTKVDLECLLTADGFNVSVDEETISIPKLCETQNSQAPGRSTWTIELTSVRQDVDADDKHWTSLVRGTSGFLVVRYGKPYDTAYAASDKVLVFPIKFGERRPNPVEANGAITFTQTAYVAGQPEMDAVVAA